MRKLILMSVCCIAAFSAITPAYAQQKMELPKEKSASDPEKMVDSNSQAFVNKGSAQDYQKDNPLLKTDLTKTSKFEGKMFETKEYKQKQFSEGKEVSILINKTFTQNSKITDNKNSWQNKDAAPLKNSDLSGKQSLITDKKANVGGSDVTVKMAKSYDGKVDEAKQAPGYEKMLSQGQQVYTGPGSPQNPTEIELIKERLKKISPEELKKNQLTEDEVKTILQPRRSMTRAKSPLDP